MRVYTDNIRYEDLKSLKQYLRSLKDRRGIDSMAEMHLEYYGDIDETEQIIPNKTHSIARKQQTVYISGEIIENDIIIVDWTDKQGNNYIRVITHVESMPYEVKNFYRLRQLRSILGSSILLTSKDNKTIYGKCGPTNKTSYITEYVCPKGVTAYIGKIVIDVDSKNAGDVFLRLDYRDWYQGSSSRTFKVTSGRTVIEDIIKIEPNSTFKLWKTFSTLSGDIRVEITIVETYGIK